LAAIHLLPLGDVPGELPARLAPPLEARFAVPVLLDAPEPARPEWLDPARGQYRAAAILASLLAVPPADGGWRLALLAGDLFDAGLESAAGLSTVGGCCGIVALGRLAADGAGGAGGADGATGPAAADTLFRRVLVEAVHEIGHMAGLGHCADERCVMHASRSVVETDRKGPDFCARCRQGAPGV